MYALDNIKKFLEDHPEIDPIESAAILARAEKLTERGMFSGGAPLIIFGNSELADHFEMEVATGQHIAIDFNAMRRSMETDSDNPILVGMIS